MSLKLKFSFLIAGIIFLVLSIVCLVLAYRSIKGLETNLIQKDTLIAEKYTPELLSDFANYYVYQYENYLNSAQKKLEEHPDLSYFRVVNSDLESVFDSSEVAEKRSSGKDPSTVNDPVIKKVFDSRKIYQDFVTEGGIREIRIVIPYIDNFDVLRNVVEYHFSLKEINQTILETAIFFVSFLLVFTLLGVTISVFSIRVVTRPLDDLTKAVTKLGTGEMGQQVKVETHDEVGLLATAFNSMSSGLKESWLLLQEEKAILSSSINSLVLGFALVDESGKIVLTNPSLEKILGSDFSEERIDKIQEVIGTTFSLSDSQDFKEVTFGQKFLHVFVTPVGEGRGTVVLFEDITEAKIIERSRDEFFSIASHELRTPLTSIRGNTSMIKDIYSKDFKDPELTEMIDDIHSSALRLIDIVNDFLNVSRLELGKDDFKKEKFDLVSLSSEVVKELGAQADGKKLTLELLDPKSKAIELVSDMGRVKEVLLNLVGNAINYTDKGRITIGFEKKTKEIEIFVSDTGKGIEVENQKLLFHKFQQAGSNLLTRDTTRSTGLGLYISKLIVEGLGGKIYLKSSEFGKGSTFAFSLPI